METIRLVYPVEGGDLIEAGEASSKMKLTLKKLGLPQDVIRRASICMYEGEISVVIHADGGQAEVEVDMDEITIRMVDHAGGLLHRRADRPGAGLRRWHGPAQYEALLRRDDH